MIVTIAALLASFIVPLAMFFFMKSSHKDDENYQKDCNTLLLKGSLLAPPVFLFSLAMNLLFTFVFKGNASPLLKAIFKAFFLAALSEEIMKYLVANKTIQNNKAKVSFLDVMAYTCIAAIGFELMEAVVYVFITNVPQILVRGITCMHGTFGLIMGYILAKQWKTDKNASPVLAILAATLIHGAYDFCLNEIVYEGAGGYIALAIAIFCLAVNIFSFFYIRKKREEAYYTEPLFPEAAAQTETNEPAAQ
ncbi:MAG: PrsW family intramembrane metalloprotease [Solobacterium sp.]|nr:PrsW family intramembrane metalloprotease [Solobacterium sp.]